MRHRSANDLEPLGTTGAPTEVAPMIGALNGLFERVKNQREREQNFTAFAAHELKTPLAGLKAQAEIASIAPDEETRAHALLQIRRSVERTDRLARQLLDLTATEAKTAGGPNMPLAQVVMDVVRDLEPQAEARGLTVTAGPLSDLTVSPLLSPALRNLIENALQASPSGETVEIMTQRGGDAIEITVKDRGPGIAPADRARITERFYRGATASGGGSGLGLAIAEAAASRLGGTLTLRPREGGGEEATIRLPA